ncbi:SKI family transcriptional corepressor 1 [Fasciola hepatica]|uniref:SKI family transcriptional corepressor 1 n=1 Tax=Fasciola hepatica TaxID=6192 RepID=A0A2H1CG98_FASHE|nr:SKI family transcriptional corepressor 1 [Fasciola hepatica]
MILGRDKDGSCGQSCEQPLDFSMTTTKACGNVESLAMHQSSVRIKKERRRFSSSASTAMLPLVNREEYEDQNTVLHDVIYNVVVRGESLVCLEIGGIQRLCLAQISSTLLKNFSYNEIHNRRVALGITCVQCSPAQLELLRESGAMPASSRRCGTITRREAERLVKSFLDEPEHPKLPDGFAFDVIHHCGWGCTGQFVPSRYNSSRAKCVRCSVCQAYFSPNKFVFHSHLPQSTGIPPNPEYRHPDAANFNAWRRHLFLAQIDPSVDLIYAWEDVKAMFNGGNRKRGSNPSIRSTSQSSSDGRPNSTCRVLFYEEEYEQTLESAHGSKANMNNYDPEQGFRIGLTTSPDESSKRKRPVSTGTYLKEKCGNESRKQKKSSQSPANFSVRQMLNQIDRESNLERPLLGPSCDIVDESPEQKLFASRNSRMYNLLNSSVKESGPHFNSVCSTSQTMQPEQMSNATRRAFKVGFNLATSSDSQEHKSLTECSSVAALTDDVFFHNFTNRFNTRDVFLTGEKPAPASNLTTSSSFQSPFFTGKPDSESSSGDHPWSVLFAQKFWQSACTSFSVNSPQWLDCIDGVRTRLDSTIALEEGKRS